MQSIKGFRFESGEQKILKETSISDVKGDLKNSARSFVVETGNFEKFCLGVRET